MMKQTLIVDAFFLGCGKTTLTVAAIRDEVVRRHFERIAWQAASQKPNIFEMQARLFTQLFDKKLGDESATDLGLGFQQLQQGSKGHTFLVVLDDVSNKMFHCHLVFS